MNIGELIHKRRTELDLTFKESKKLKKFQKKLLTMLLKSSII